MATPMRLRFAGRERAEIEPAADELQPSPAGSQGGQGLWIVKVLARHGCGFSLCSAVSRGAQRRIQGEALQG